VLEKRFLKQIDWVLLVAVLVLTVYGLLMIYSSARGVEGATAADAMGRVKKQAVWIVLSVIAGGLMMCFDYNKLVKLAAPVYWVTLGLLVMVFVFPAFQGAHRWLMLGPLRLQPSEFAKLAMVLTLAVFLAEREDHRTEGRLVLASLGYVAAPMLLIFLEPDLGTSLVFFAVWLGMLFLFGARLSHLAAVVAGGGLVFVLMWWLDLLKWYHKMRIQVLLDPSVDPTGFGYQLAQSKTAIALGALTGQGFCAGTMSRLNFVPAARTDFIFTVVGEELGFVGAVLLLGLYALIIARGLSVIKNAKDLMGVLLATGVVLMLSFHAFVNVGMTMGIMPVVGLPLPFFSYGGSSMLLNMMAIGLLQNVHIRRHKITF
jgi:rod shape determining protein RodA